MLMKETISDIEAKGVWKEFVQQDGPDDKTLVTLEDIHFHIHEKEFVSIVGPSGCGKTTLLKIIAGLSEATRGEMRIGSGGEPKPTVSVVFQNSGLFPWMSVRKNVESGLAFLHHRLLTRQEQERCDDFIRMVGLQGFENYYPYQLSGGMQSRVGLARALVRNPKILLMDEPFGALDAQTKALMQEQLQNLWVENKMTVLFITHDLEEAVYLSDRVFLMTKRPGKIKQIFDVDLPRPRKISDPAISEIRNCAWESLREELL